MKIERELLRGAGPLAVLKLLESGEKYGYQLVEALSGETGGVLAMGQSTLYPLLYNLEAKSLIAAEWRLEQDSAGRPRKYYRLTDAGRRRLAEDTRRWSALAGAMERLGIAPNVARAFTARREVPA